jgi:hypothetical protein
VGFLFFMFVTFVVILATLIVVLIPCIVFILMIIDTNISKRRQYWHVRSIIGFLGDERGGTTYFKCVRFTSYFVRYLPATPLLKGVFIVKFGNES